MLAALGERANLLGRMTRYTVSAGKWNGMKGRQAGGGFQARHPTYIGCKYAPPFRDFQF
jgi:hypothetical protein